jgi:DNA-binding NarL/FixJ family response regulator
VYSPIRVVIVDDHPLYRDGLLFALSCHADIAIVGVGGSRDDAVRLAAELEPDVLVTDMNMPGGGLSAIAGIVAAGSSCKVLVLSMVDDIETVGAALAGGAFGYMLKGGGGMELAQAIRALNQGDRYISPSLAVELLTRPAARSPGAGGPFSALTQRETDVLSIMVEGRSNKEIGNKLDLSEKTIKHHVTRILQKLSVRNRVEAALMAARREPAEQRLH